MFKNISRQFSQKLSLVLFVWSTLLASGQAVAAWAKISTHIPVYTDSEWYDLSEGPFPTTSATIEVCNKLNNLPGFNFRWGGSRRCRGSSIDGNHGYDLGLRYEFAYQDPNPPPPEPEVTYTISISSIISPPYKNYVTSMDPSLTKGLVVKVMGSDGNPGNIPVNMTVTAIDDTGGHVQAHHNARNPTHSGVLEIGSRKGTSFNNITINGVQEFKFTSPKSSGDHLIEISCPNHTCTQTKPDKIWVGIKDLKALPGSQLYQFIGDTDAHPDNHYVSDLAAKKIDNIAFVYDEEFPDFPVLHINDISLERGGLFDNSGEWTPPHQLHRTGMDIDIRAHENLGKPGGNVPVQNYKEFVSISKQHGCRARIHLGGSPGEHFHLYCYEKYGK